jgi:hypothetical protein
MRDAGNRRQQRKGKIAVKSAAKALIEALRASTIDVVRKALLSDTSALEQLGIDSEISALQTTL